ncbi:MAG: hypothetical protein HUU55_12445 [Myxococcales bacterium]|nr:hypothetical protein [Myxococcales bacterium]
MRNTRSGSRWIPILIAVLLGCTTTATAADIYINGVKVGAIADLQLNNCNIRFDSRGDLHITAPGYQVAGGPTQTTAGVSNTAPVLQNNYFLTTTATKPGAAQYRFELYINGNKVREFSSLDSGLALSLNTYLTKGKNTVGIKAYKDMGIAVAAPDRSDAFEIVIGEGRGRGDTLLVDKVLWRIRKVGSDLAADSQQINVIAD